MVTTLFSHDEQCHIVQGLSEFLAASAAIMYRWNDLTHQSVLEISTSRFRATHFKFPHERHIRMNWGAQYGENGGTTDAGERRNRPLLEICTQGYSCGAEGLTCLSSNPSCMLRHSWKRSDTSTGIRAQNTLVSYYYLPTV